MTRIATPPSLRRKLALTSALGMSLGVFAAPAAAQITPIGTIVPNVPGTGISSEVGAAQPTVTSSSVPVLGQPTVNTVNIALGADRTLINWTTLNVVSNATQTDTLNFSQSTAVPTVAVLNRVSVGTTTLSGTINAPGVEVWISNPNGLVFGASGNFNGAALIATTLNIGAADAQAFLSYTSMKLTAPNAASNGITGAINTINTNGGTLVLLAPVINLTGGNFNAGTTGNVAFVTASEVTIATPTIPFAITIDKGVAVNGDGIVALAGTVTAGNLYAVVTAQTAINALLNVAAGATTASATNGIVVLGGDNGGAAIGPIDFGTAMGNNHTGTAAVTTGGGLTANGGGSIGIRGNTTIAVNGALATNGAGNIAVANYGTITAANTVAVAGDVTSTGGYSVTGGKVTLGANAVGVTQTATGAVTISALADTLTSVGTLALTADSNGTGDAMVLGGATGIDFIPTGAGNAAATLTAGDIAAVGGAASTIDFTTLSPAATFRIGNVRAATLSQGGGPAGTISRSSAITTGDLTLAGANSITSTAGALNTGAVTAGGNVTLQGVGTAIGGTVNGSANVTLGAGTGALATGANPINVGGSYAVTAGTFTGTALTPTFTGAATHNFTITDTAGGLTIGALTAPDTLTITTLAGGTLTTTGLLTSTNAAVNLTGAGGISLGGNVQSGTTQSYTGTVTLTADDTLTSSGAGAAGAVSFNSAVTGAQALTVATAGLTTFNGVVGATPLTSLTVNNGPTSAAANISTSGAQSYTGQFRLAGPVTLAGTTGTFTGGILGNTNNLTLNFTAPTTLTTVAGVNDLGVGGGSTTTLGGTISTTGTQTYTDTLILNAATTLSSSGTGAAGNITLAAIGGATNTLAVNTTGGGTTTFNGNATGLGSLTTDSAGLTVINAASLSTAGSNGPQTFDDAVRLDASTSIDAGSSSIAFNGTVVSLNEAQGLTTASTTTFAQNVGGALGGGVRLASLTTQQGTTIGLVGGTGTRTIRTLGAQSYNTLSGGLTLNTNAVLTGSVGAFNGTITGNGGGTDHDLALNFMGATTINGLTVSGVRDFETDNAGVVSGTLTLSGALATSGKQTFNDAVTLSGASVSVSSTGAGTITFGNTLDSSILPAAASALTVNTAGTVIFAGVVGGTTPLVSITAAGPGSTPAPAQVQVQANVTTTGAQSYAPVLLNGATDIILEAGAGNIALGGLAGVVGAERRLTINSTGTTTINGNNGVAVLSITTNTGGNTTLRNQINTLQDQTYNDAVTLGAATTLTARRAVFTGGVTGAGNNLTLTISGTGANAQVLGANITGVQDLTVNGTGDLSLSGAITTTGNQSFTNPITLTAATNLTASGAGKTITFVGPTTTVNGAFALATTASQTNFNANVGQTPGAVLASLQVTGIATTGGAGPRLITTTGTQQYGGQLQLGNNTVLTGSGGIFSGGVLGNGNDLTLNFGTSTAIGPPFSGIDDLIVNGPASLSGTISAGTQTYNGATTVIGAGATLLSSATTGSNGIVFGTTSTLNGTQPLTITTAGNTVLGGVIGNTAPGLGSLTVNGTGAVLFNNGNVTTSGSQSYTGPATLNAATTLTSSVTAPANAVTFLSTVNGAQTLTVTAPGTTVFGGEVGGATPLTSVSITNGATQLNTGAVMTTGNQSYAGQLRLSTTTVLTGTNTTPPATFSATGGVLGNNNNLTLNFAGVTTIGGGFGGIQDLVVNGPTNLSGTISARSQTYNGANTLTGATTLVGTGSAATGAITFGPSSTLSGAQALTITTAGTTTFNGQVGNPNAPFNLTPLALLVVNGPGAIQFNNTGGINTTGVQTYTGPATLGVNTPLTTSGGNIGFQGTVDGPFVLSARTGAATPPTAGVISFGSTVGGTTALTGLAIRANSATATGAANRVGTIAALLATGGLAYKDADDLVVGTVDGLSGISIAAGTADITSANRLILVGNITATGAALTGNTSHTQLIGVTQSGGEIVNVGAGTILIDGNDGTLNFQGTLSSTNTGTSAIRLIDASSLVLNTVTAGNGVGLGTLTLGEAGGDRITGTVTQIVGSVVTAGTLAGNIGGAVTLTNANKVGTLAGFAASSLDLVNVNQLIVGALPSPAGSVTITNGVTLTTTGGGMVFNGNVSAATATLISAAAITQPAGNVFFGTLTGSSNGGTALTQVGNSVTTLAGFTNTGGGGFELLDISALAITAGVAGGGGVLTIGTTANPVPSITFTGQSLSAAGNVTLTATGGISGLGNGSVNGGAIQINGGSFASVSGVGGSSIGMSGGTVFLGTGVASTTATLTAGNGVTVATSLSAGTGASATTTAGLADIALITSTNGLVEVRGATAQVGTATATNGALQITSTAGGLTLTTGFAGTAAMLSATGTVTGGVDSGTIAVTNVLNSGGNASLTATGNINAVAGVTSTTGTIGLTTTNIGDVTFGTLDASALKSVNAKGAIAGGSIVGTGAVSLIAATASPIVITGTIGTTAVRAASLTVNGGSAVTLGTTAATAVATSGAVSIGQGPGAVAGALTVNGTIDAGTAIAATATGLVDLDNLIAGTTVSVISNADAVNFDTLTAPGAATLTSTVFNAALALTGNSIDAGGTLQLVAGTASPLTIGAIGVTKAATSLTVNGGSTATLGTVAGAGTTTVNVNGITRIGQLADGAATGVLVVNGNVVNTGTVTSTTTGATTFADVTSTGALAVTTGAGNATFATLKGAGGKTVMSGQGIIGTAIQGAGPVTLVAATTSPITIGSIGVALPTAAPVASLTINGGNVVTIGSTGSTATNLVVTGATSIGQGPGAATGALIVNGPLTTGTLTSTTTGSTTVADVAAGGAVAITATGGRIGYTTIGAGSIALNAGGSVTGGVLNSGAAVGVISGGATTITGGTSGGTGNFAVAATGAATISGAVTAGGGYSVRGSSVSLGTGATAQSAKGLVDITSTNGALTASNGLVLSSNTDGAGSEYLVIDATGGPIAFGNATLNGGTAANRSDVGVLERTGGQTVTVGTVNARSLAGVNAARSSFGVLTNAGDIVETGPITVQQTLALTSTGGLITLNTVDVTGAGQGITLITSAPGGGAVSASRLTAANGAVSIDARGAVTVPTIATTTGGVGATSGSIRGASVDLGTVNVGGGTLGVTSTAGQLRVNTVTSGITTLDATGALEVTNTLTTTGLTTIKSTGNSALRQVRVTGAALDVNATGAVSGLTTARADLAAAGTGGNVTIKAGTSALLGPIASGGNAALTAATTLDVSTTTAAGSVTMTGGAIAAGATTAGTSVTMIGSGIATTGLTTTGTTLTVTSTGAISMSPGASVGTDAIFDAGTLATLGQVIAGTTSGITIKALDADITGTQRAARVTFTNRSPATNTIKLGTGVSSGAGFLLTTTEVNNVEAAQLTIDGGTGNVQIGQLGFDGDAGKTRVDVLSTGRIDVTGAVSGAGAGRTFRFGGTTANTTDKAAVIRIVATVGTAPSSPSSATNVPTDAGGRLLFDADLDVRGGRIGVGLLTSFLDPIGFGPGQTALSAATVGADYVGNPNSALYNSTFGPGGTIYNNPTLLTARSLTVRYTDYALIQNTGTPGNNTGVVLGSMASPSTPALVVQALGSTVNAFALFGSINGITDTGAAVSGSSVVQVSGADLGNTRINGCLAGSGAGCLSSVVSQPLLNIFDSSRLAVFRAADDLALPFDPVVGTNNEALFSGFGLIDSPVTDTECSTDTTNPACGQNKEQAK